MIRSTIALLSFTTLVGPVLAQSASPLTSDPHFKDVGQPACLGGICADDGYLPIMERERRKGFPDLTIAYPERESPKFMGAALVSTAQLQNPLSKQGKKLLESAQSHLKSGKRPEALRELKSALEDPSAAGYAHGILGGEWLKAGQFDAAIQDLRAAVELMPGYHVFHANLADAFYCTLQYQDAEREARQALRLNWNSALAHYILGLTLLAQNRRSEEALDHLREAQGTLAGARAALATYYVR